MAARKRTEITVETDQVLIIRRRRSIRAWCRECACDVDMVGMGEAEVITGMSERVLRDCAQARQWHLSEGSDGTTLACLESLMKSM